MERKRRRERERDREGEIYRENERERESDRETERETRERERAGDCLRSGFIAMAVCEYGVNQGVGIRQPNTYVNV